MKRSAYQFFRSNAGYSYDPKTESRQQGRNRCARKLAAAERYADEQGWSCEWSYDWDGDHSYLQDGETIETCEFACLVDENGRHLASLGCIDDATPEYRRVIEAELALEAME